MSWSVDAPDCGEWCFRSLVLTPEAQSYLAMLRALGHLDTAREERFMAELSPACESLREEVLVVDRERLRTRLAEFLFREHDKLGPEHRELLEGEWPLLFG